MRSVDDWNPSEDRRPAEPLAKPSHAENGDRCWVWTVLMPATRAVPVDSYCRFWIWERAIDGVIVTKDGRYWPKAQGDGDEGSDGA